MKLRSHHRQVHSPRPKPRTSADSLYSDEPPANDEGTEAQLKEAEAECLGSRAAYMLRQSVVEDVLIADPILKAVHSGANATATERQAPRATFVSRRGLMQNAGLCILLSIEEISYP